MKFSKCKYVYIRINPCQYAWIDMKMDVSMSICIDGQISTAKHICFFISIVLMPATPINQDAEQNEREFLQRGYHYICPAIMASANCCESSSIFCNTPCLCLNWYMVFCNWLSSLRIINANYQLAAISDSKIKQ